MDETVDYQGLFEVIRKENERLRMQIVGLKDNGYTVKERVNDWISSLDPIVVLQLLLALSLALQIVMPLIQWLMERLREK